jgi:hypothetical protein
VFQAETERIMTDPDFVDIGCPDRGQAPAASIGNQAGRRPEADTNPAGSFLLTSRKRKRTQIPWRLIEQDEVFLRQIQGVEQLTGRAIEE